MRSSILLLPSLLLIGFALVLSESPDASRIPTTKAARDAEIGQLQRQLQATSARLANLEASGHSFVPR
jgi:hypothetical protein